jgi:hypothetical protein
MSRKYISEFGLNALGHSVLLQQDGLDKLDQIGLPEDMPLHIYMIARRPRITLDPASIQIDDQTVRGRLTFTDKIHLSRTISFWETNSAQQTFVLTALIRTLSTQSIIQTGSRYSVRLHFSCHRFLNIGHCLILKFFT